MKRWATALLLVAAPSCFAQYEFASPPSWVTAAHLDRFDGIWLGLYGWQWIGLIGLVLISLLIGYMARHIATVALRMRYRIPGLEFSQSSKRGTRKAVAIIVAAIIWTLAVDNLGLPPATELLTLRILQIVSTLAGVWLLASLWNAFCDLLLHRSQDISKRTERLLVPLTRKFITAVILIAGLLTVLAVVGVNVISIIAGLGIGGIAVALAAKDSVENLFGSLTIMFDMPFALGDWVRIDKVEGVVEEINLRSTRIRTFEDSMITLPNSNLIRAAVENFGARRFRRQKFTLRVALNSNPEAVEAFTVDIRNFIAQMEGAVPERTIVELNEITEQWIGILVICFLRADAQVDELRKRSELMSQILRLAKKRKLQFSPAPPAAEANTGDQAESALPKVE